MTALLSPSHVRPPAFLVPQAAEKVKECRSGVHLGNVAEHWLFWLGVKRTSALLPWRAEMDAAVALLTPLCCKGVRRAGGRTCDGRPIKRVVNWGAAQFVGLPRATPYGRLLRNCVGVGCWSLYIERSKHRGGGAGRQRKENGLQRDHPDRSTCNARICADGLPK